MGGAKLVSGLATLGRDVPITLVVGIPMLPKFPLEPPKAKPTPFPSALSSFCVCLMIRFPSGGLVDADKDKEKLSIFQTHPVPPKGKC